ncbi:MAG: FMN-binding protein [Sphaerochaeta sp.]|jgi:Na+-transporting NADH:ubiquinone oxidoreductase subunit C|nr:FMN-binding protein [Sphaerochaeta sp.]PKL28650.1 MAG: FMN-binding protein [Spirochaetae bacterium HGW-Spirochaetae-2]
MKTQSFYAKRIQPLVFMALVTVACILVTAALHLSTLERVQINEQFFLWRSVLDAAAISHDGQPESVAALFADMAKTEGNQYTVQAPDGSTRYVVEITGPGLWGPITIMAGFEEDLKTLAGISIVSQSETPGLGARIEERWFTSQFAGKQGPFRLVEEGTADAPEEIDAITGATITSESVRNIMNRVIAESGNISRGQ